MRSYRGLVGAVVAMVVVACASTPGGLTAERTPARPSTVPRPATVTTAPGQVGQAAVVLARSHVPVLCYHQIRDWRPADSRTDRSVITPVAVFEQQMNTLARLGYHAITPEQLYRYLSSGTPLPAQPILISFDDGSMGQWPNAVPLLRAHGFTATFFIMTVTIDKPGGWLSRSQVQALDRSGMTIGVHTWDHHPVTGYRPSDWRVQLTGAKATLERIVAHPVPWFAYPYGSWNPAALPHLVDGGVLMAFQLAGPGSRAAPLLTVRRLMPSPFWSMDAFVNQIRSQF